MDKNMTKLSAFPRLFLFAMNNRLQMSGSLPCRKVRMMLLEVSVALFQKYSEKYAYNALRWTFFIYNSCFIGAVKHIGCSYNNVTFGTHWECQEFYQEKPKSVQFVGIPLLVEFSPQDMGIDHFLVNHNDSKWLSS